MDEVMAANLLTKQKKLSFHDIKIPEAYINYRHLASKNSQLGK